jgi:peptidoglycan/LPS O-acetylase OafA/YrhL
MMTPEQLRYYLGGAFASILSFSNVWFYNRIDYFNPAAAEDPLIHTWSLGIEEQFYILFPFIVYFCLKRGQKFLQLMTILFFATSFILATIISQERPQEAFYLLHTRAWELLAGVICVFLLPFASKLSTSKASCLAAFGFALVLGSMIYLPSTTEWPNSLTILPIIGSMQLMLFGNRGIVVKSILGSTPLVFVGLLSYSAYLWHQPILGFISILDISIQQPSIAISVFILTFAFAYLSWRFIEQPFRKDFGSSLVGRNLLMVGALIISGFAFAGHVTKGYAKRMPDSVLHMLTWSQSVPKTYKKCIGGRKENNWLDPNKACIHGAKNTPPSVAIWGDSHAAVLSKPLGDALALKKLSVKELTVSSCAPITNVKNFPQKRASYCPIHNQKMLDYIVNNKDIEFVIIVATWNSYFQFKDYNNKAGFTLTDKIKAIPINLDENIADNIRINGLSSNFRSDLMQLVKANKKIIVIGPLPEPGFNLPDRLARSILHGLPKENIEAFPSLAYYQYSAVAVQAIQRALSAIDNITYIDASQLFCNQTRCSLVDSNSNPLFFDGNHLSLAGSAKIVPLIISAIDQKSSKRY